MLFNQGKEKPPQQMDEKKDMKGKDSDIVYPSGLKFLLLMISIFAAMFLVSLVR